MKKFLLYLLIFTSATAICQEDAWVHFTAKPNSDFYFANPLEMLSQRALDRREAQNISLDLLDVPIPQAFIDQVENASGITVMAKSKWLNAVHVRGTADAINALLLLDVVAHIDFADDSLDTAGRNSNFATVANTSKRLETQADFPYGGSGNQIQMLNGHILHEQDYTGTGKIIAVMDAGFPEVDVVLPFQRLWDNNLILGGYNFVDRSTDIYTRSAHGTMVLSTMGGYVADQLVGTAPDAQYYLFITEDTGSENPVEESYWVEAAEMADSLGVDIINTSLGYFHYDDTDYSYVYSDLNGTKSFVSRGADIAFSRGMIVVVAAGNNGASSDPHITVPADAVNVLTVGAVNPSGVYAAFSAIGPAADGRLKPDIVAQGQSAVFSTPSGNVTTGNGTSFSSPIISGMVASLWQALPDRTNAEIVELIKESAHLAASPDNFHGFGIPDFALALDNALDVADFYVYPGIVQGQLSISFPPGTRFADISIYAVTGQLISTTRITANSPEIFVGGISSGIYIYKIVTTNGISTGKFLKQ